jgi:rhamnosyl/mannosyltransferase
MNILHIGKYYPPVSGGIENFMGDLLPALNADGVTTAALVHQHSADKPTSHDQNNIIRVPCYGSLLYTPVSPGFPGALSKIISRFRPDIIHIHMPNVSAFWLLGSKKARQIPWVIHWHSDVIASKIDPGITLAYQFYRPFEQKILCHAAHIICTSAQYRDTSIPLQSWLDKCTVIPLGINPERLEILTKTDVQSRTKDHWFDQTRFKIIVVGRLTCYKGHETIIKAAKHCSDIQIIIAGTGDQYHKLNRSIQKRELHNTIKLTGHLPDRVLHTLIQSGDCLCLPSIERTEAFGLVLLEAMHYAKPVIATSVHGSGMNWVVDHNQTGILVPPADHIKLADSIKRLKNSPESAQQLGRAGKQKIDKSLQINQIASAVKTIYTDILSP